MTDSTIIAQIRASKPLSKDFDKLSKEKKREVLQTVKNDNLTDIGEVIVEVRTGQRRLLGTTKLKPATR